MSHSGKLLTFWILLALLLGLLASVASAAGGVGHFYIAKRSAEKLKSMVEADELGILLRDPSCLNAFCNGAIAPDLACLVNKAHYGQTTELPQRLINQAEDAWEAATKLPASDPKRAGKLKEAEKAMAFGLGWLSHCAVDLAIHPKVNAQCGDIYEFLDSGGKAKHAAMEIQFTAYLTKSLRKPEDKIAFDIPYWLVSSVSGISQKELEGSVKVMRGKLVAEVAAANQVQLTVSMLRSDWQSIVDKCLADTIDFILNPEHMEDWDLDCGRISTEDFHGLRDECLEITGGARPADWGKNYLNWWEQVRYLSAEQRHQWLVELLQGERTYQPGRKEVLVRTDGNQKLWVNGKEIKYPGNNVVQVPTSGVLTLQVLLYQTYRYICTDHKYRGDNVSIITENPFELHYTSTLYGGPYEHRTMMVKEAYTWKAYDNPGTVKNSGAHPNLIDDVFEWKVPTVRNVYGDSKTFTINIECQSEWYQYELHGNPPEVYLDSNPHMLLMIEVEDEIQD